MHLTTCKYQSDLNEVTTISELKVQIQVMEKQIAELKEKMKGE